MTKANAELKLKYNADFLKVRSLVNEFDPCGLIHHDFPEDEYDCLTGHLLNAVYDNKTPQEIKNLILHEIEHHFGTPDLDLLVEPYKTDFYSSIDKLIENLNNLKEHKPSS